MIKSNSWSFIPSLDNTSFRKSQIYETHPLSAEPICPFLDTPQTDVNSEKHKAALGNSRNLPIPKEQYWSLITAAVQMIQALRKP